MPTLGDFIHAQYLAKIPKPTASFAAKTVIITGANGGLGKETAKHIVRLGAAKVILACRSLSKGNQTKAEIEASLFPPSTPTHKHHKPKPNNSKPNTDNDTVLEVWELDLESVTSIRAFVTRVNAALPRLDVLINNAGIHSFKFGLARGMGNVERTLAVNVVGTFLLAFQLVPKLRETARTYGVVPHLTTVGSALYDTAKFPEMDKGGNDDIFAWSRDEKHFDWLNQYNLSKLLQIHILVKLSSLIDPVTTTTTTTNPTTNPNHNTNPNPNPNPNTNQITINTLDPTFCKTNLGSSSPEMPKAIKLAGKIFTALTARTAEEGARLVVQAASAGRATHGLYQRAGAVRGYDPCVLDRVGKERGEVVWKGLCGLLEGIEGGVVMGCLGCL